MLNVLERVNAGAGLTTDIDLLQEVAQSIFGKCLCPLGDFATSAVTSSIQHWRDDYASKTTETKKAAPARPGTAPKPSGKPKPTSAAKPAPMPKQPAAAK
jgi:NADH-quinone oxidoreductase subunit F